MPYSPVESRPEQDRWRVRGEVRTQRQVWLRTIVGSLMVVAVADVIDLVANLIFAPWQIVRSAVQTTLISALLGAYVIYTHARSNLKLYEIKNHLALLSITDPLTGLLNRRAFFERADAIVAGADTHVLILVDVDSFKKVNDRFGHPVGDAVIQRISQLMTAHFPATGSIARIGGEEFSALLVSGPADDARARAVAFCAAVGAETFFAGAVPFLVTVSVGLARFGPGQAVADVYAAADAQLYRAKHAGGNQVACEGGS
jgi:diguanylate cyclase (GGDEF)-like protein